MITEITALYLGLGVVFIIGIILLAVAISINNNLKILFHQQAEVLDNFNNLNNASRRIEKLCDAINQRTRAHLVSVTKPKASTKDKDTASKSLPKNSKKTGKSNEKYSKYHKVQTKQTNINVPNAANFTSIDVRTTSEDQN